MKPKNCSIRQLNAATCINTLVIILTASLANLHADTWINTGATGSNSPESLVRAMEV